MRKHVLAMREAQATVAKMTGFSNTAELVKSTPYLRAEPTFDGGYLYHGSAETFYLTGRAFGKATIELSNVE